ncbi:MAG: zinc ribbon domain-containing protein [Nitrospirae bacterium]|nr:zinc ribbon domain-containing protein [Nitrospirota bacterium]
MPIYEYECVNCGEIREVVQRFSDEPLTTCPDCNGRLKKIISNTSFILKGTGWYKTDYASDSGRRTGEVEKTKESDNKSAVKTETKTETETETKTEPKAEAAAKA